MDFKESFLNALHSSLSMSKSISIQDYLPKSIPVPRDIKENLPYIQGYGFIKSSFPYHYELEGLNTCCLLLTEQGSGTLTKEGIDYPLTPGSLSFIDCNTKHRIEIKHSPWHYKIFFINGNPIPYLHTAFSAGQELVYTIQPISPILRKIQKLYELLVQENTNYILHSKYLLDILLETLLEKKQAGGQTAHLPDYLVKIKQTFDEEYVNKITLDMLEKKYQVNKYQICREFTSFYGTSPIKYLNTVRISAAKEALIYTDKRINEIGRMTGFENTNHFIRLFKQKAGITPLTFRKSETLVHP